MIVIKASADFENDPRILGHVVPVAVREQPDIRRGTDDDLGAFRLRQHADAERIGHRDVLVKGLLLVHHPVAIGVFEDHHAIALGAKLHVAAIVHTFDRPDASLRIDLDVRRILDHRLGGDERDLESVGGLEGRHVFLRDLEAVALVGGLGESGGARDQGGGGCEEEGGVGSGHGIGVGMRCRFNRVGAESLGCCGSLFFFGSGFRRSDRGRAAAGRARAASGKA